MTLQDTLQNGTKPGLNLDRLGLGLLATRTVQCAEDLR